jgi:DNA invertase Pin-like site-specific DNA recombinase
MSRVLLLKTRCKFPDRQGKSGLGLEAQREAVLAYLNGGSWTMVAEFTEIESGKHADRPQLAAALAACKKHKAKLVIAKLDRLSRNLAFIATLMDSGVEFLAVDNPHANKLTVHILAAVAQHEREAIAQRTRDALQAAKARGKRLGNPNLERARQRALAYASHSEKVRWHSASAIDCSPNALFVALRDSQVVADAPGVRVAPRPGSASDAPRPPIVGGTAPVPRKLRGAFLLARPSAHQCPVPRALSYPRQIDQEADPSNNRAKPFNY